MEIQYKYGALILAGGQAKRMGGIQKAELTYGMTTFLSMLERTLSFLEPAYLSTNKPQMAQGTGLEPVADLFPCRGPMGGIYSALKKCSCDALLVVPCDMPFFSRDLAEFLLREHQGEAVLYLQDENEREFPLCGIYTRDCIPVIEELMTREDFRVRQILRQAGGRILPVPTGVFPSQCFYNVNTPAVYQQICSWYQE
ncbi:MAG: molybdenum cofactor guanylyltransferase [Lachnospiraceae bacterium]